MKEIGLIGFGAFGKVIYDLLKVHFNFFIFDLNKDFIPEKKYASIEECAGKDIVILSIPVQNLSETLTKISKFIKNDALILDVCSVKIKPIELMKKHLPIHCDIIGTHPLFGPASIKEGINGLKIVLSPVRSERLEKVRMFLEETLKIKTIIKTAEEHDKEMANVQALTHFIVKGLNDLNLKESELKTLSYDYLCRMKEVLKSESDALFQTIEKENPFAGKIRKDFIEKLITLDKEIK